MAQNYDGLWTNEEMKYMIIFCIAIAIAIALGLGLGLGLPRETLSNQQNKDYEQ